LWQIKKLNAGYMQYTIKLADSNSVTVEKKSGEWYINGNKADIDIIKIGEDKYHLIINNQSVEIELSSRDYTSKNLHVIVDGIKTTVGVETPLDALLKSMGMDKMLGTKLNQVKAPMPGMVLRIIAQSGQDVKKGDALLVLEAMKMENIIKSPIDGTIKSIDVTERNAVEKNQTLISFT
jgi:biotin carboxyl carrier protein